MTNLKETGWIHLALDSDQWQTLVRTGINFQDSINGKEFLEDKRLLISQEELCFTQLVWSLEL